jgi:hypothetical protein
MRWEESLWGVRTDVEAVHGGVPGGDMSDSGRVKQKSGEGKSQKRKHRRCLRGRKARRIWGRKAGDGGYIVARELPCARTGLCSFFVLARSEVPALFSNIVFLWTRPCSSSF